MTQQHLYYLITALGIVSASLGTTCYRLHDELEMYKVNDQMYLEKSKEHCDYFRWKRNDKQSWFGCDMLGKGYYTTTSSYNKYGELLAESSDEEGDGLFERQLFYNAKGEKVREYQDKDRDGFFDKYTVFKHSEAMVYIDQNRDGLFEESEIKY